MLVGCGGACAAAAPPPHPLAAKPKDEPDPGDGRQRVTVFFSRQTSTAEGFAKVPIEILLVVFMVPSTDYSHSSPLGSHLPPRSVDRG